MFDYINKTSLFKLLLFLAIIGFITYASSFTNQFVWDDIQFFHQNLFTQSLTHIREIFSSNTTAGAGVSSNYYRPITSLSFALDHQFWGWNPIGLHFTNTLFHVLNGMLLFLFLLLLRFKKTGAFLITILFLIHPIQTEAVTYLSSRGDIFYTFFLLLSLLLFTLTLYRPNVKIIFSNKTLTLTRAFFLTLCVLLFIASVLSKEGALTTIPMYAGVMLVVFAQKKISLKKFYQIYKAHIMVILLLIWITLIYAGLRLTVLNFMDSLNYSGDQSSYAKHLSIRMYTFLKTIPLYIQLLLVPYPLYLERSTAIVTTPLNWWVISSVAIIVTSLFAGLKEFSTKHTVWIYFSLILIFSNLLSVSGIIPMTALLRENWLYMPMIGFYITIYMLGQIYFSRYIKSHKTVFTICFLFMSIVLIAMTIQQNYNWRDRIAYFEHNLRFTNTARLHLNLGNSYIALGKNDKAIYHLEQAKKLDNIYPQTQYNLGNIYLMQNNLPLAEREYLESLELDPNYLYSYPKLIQIYEKERAFKKEIPYLKRLTQIYPDDLRLQINYAQALWNSREKDEAEKEFTKAIALSHNDPKLIEAINETKRVILK